MVIRIEYLLILLLVILVFSIMGINPSSQSAIKSEGEREILFENFSLFELKEDEVGSNIFASAAIKYKSHLDFKNINLSDESGDNIVAKEAIYKNNAVYMEKNITLTGKNGLIFSTETLSYKLKEKVAHSTTPFTLDFNGSKITGENLQYSMKSKEISADNIHASILFVSKKD